jgi:hypothetical protein
VAWETRRGRWYYYRSHRVEGRVIKEYVGAGARAELMARLDGSDRAERQAKRDAHAELLDDLDARLRQLDSLSSRVDAQVRTALLAAGFHRHRGEWRRRRA